jgi:hypothetical protein
MVEFVKEPVNVEVQIRRDGTARPVAFSWRGHRYRVESWGRESQETSDGCTVHCYLVQTADLATWELCQDVDAAQWTLVRRWAARPRPV